MIHRTPQARAETVDCAFYISMDSPSAGERFINAVEETLAQLEGAPGIVRFASERARIDHEFFALRFDPH